ncbi:MAG: prepilin-type N-terminal cleavage/methylation domain-containing protein [Candidatus Omnitrophica bacterium]|nr:prepilin-type N-terminal cleavage/methylation domain-containing protein [Candidatus Omnitrophota bacterium]
MPIKPFKNQGFTLVEVLIAVGILAVVIVGLLQLFVYCSVLAQDAGNVTLALSQAQNKIEEMRGHGFTNLTTDYGSGGTPGDTFALTGPNGTGTIAISQVGSAELLQLQINLAWQNKSGRNFTTTLTNFMALR